MRHTHLFLVILLVASLLPASFAVAQADGDSCDYVSLVNGWARATAPGAPNGAAFGLLVNLGDEADTLTGISSAVAEAIELHEMVMGDGDVMQMRPLANGIPVAAGGFTPLQPGGLHVMLIGLRGSLVAGETLDLTLHFAAHDDVTLTLPIIDVDAMNAMSDTMAATAELMIPESTAEPFAVPEGCAGVHVLDGWVRAAMPGMPNSAGYGLVLNLSAEPERIVSGVTDAASVLELHQMVMGDGDVMQMRPLPDGILLPPGEAVLLQPGGLHMMLIGLTGTLEPGAEVGVTLALEQAGEVELTLPVRDPNADAGVSGMGG